MNVMISSILETDQHFSQKYDWKIWLKFLLHLFLTMSQIPLDIILLYVFFHLCFLHNPLFQFHAIILFQVMITIIFLHVSGVKLKCFPDDYG